MVSHLLKGLPVLILSLAAQAQPLEVVAGEDLAAWRGIHQSPKDVQKAAESYRWFIDTYPTSSLAEVAWQRLNHLNTDDSEWVQHNRNELQKLQRSLDHHRETLENPPSQIAVASLTAEGTTVSKSTPSPWQVSVRAGAGWTGSVCGTVGAEVKYRPVGVVARFARGQDWYGEAGLRLSTPGLGPAAEFDLDTKLRPQGLVGVQIPLWQRTGIEAMGGLRYDEQVFTPALRLELVQKL
ncbi:MAG: hypothetical protein HN348_16415 [Proteobacteria bacterium]|jgi:hypothetical protein|nr:hypothetical protein [Pseudomonadota bacterium]